MSNDPIRVFCGADRSQQLAYRVLADSIRRHTARELQIRTIDNGDAPSTGDPRNAPYTEFSFARFAIPALCGYQGRAVYMDSDMLVFHDMAELWDTDMGDANVAIEIGSRSAPEQMSHARNRHAAVMLLDCARLDWNVADIVQRLGRDYDYDALMSIDPVVDPGQMQERIPVGWNDLDRYDPQRTRNLHYTEIRTQPWVSALHPHGGLWVNALRRMLDAGTLQARDVQGEVELGYARPSLLIELGLEPHEGATSPEALAAIDAQRGFVAHRKLLARFAERKRAIARHRRDHATGLNAVWQRLRYRYRHGSE